ncbi:MAG: ACT domain-containing protein [Rhodospirillales bacterium]|nr:ACT domain-containing protein [Rhodospirillales bacterium]
MPTEIVVSLANRPGALAKVAETLGKAGVNIQCACYATGAQGAVRFVADNPAKAKAALKAAKIRVKQAKPVLEVTLADKPGALARAARRLAKANVNVEAFYVVGARGKRLRCVIAVNKLAKAKAALGR